MKKIGFSGTLDPITNGHMWVIGAARSIAEEGAWPVASESAIRTAVWRCIFLGAIQRQGKCESSPVSTSDEVRVETSFNPAPSIQAWEQRQGVVAWERSMAPSETLKFNIGYRITYPREGTVAGLP